MWKPEIAGAGGARPPPRVLLPRPVPPHPAARAPSNMKRGGGSGRPPLMAASRQGAGAMCSVPAALHPQPQGIATRERAASGSRLGKSGCLITLKPFCKRSLRKAFAEIDALYYVWRLGSRYVFYKLRDFFFFHVCLHRWFSCSNYWFAWFSHNLKFSEI